MAHVANVGVHPVKALSRIDVNAARVTAGGVLADDRKYALFTDDGDAINGIETPRVHDVDASYDFESEVLTVATDEGERRRFDLRADPEEAAAWFSEFLGKTVTIRRDPVDGFVSRPEAGPSVVSTATLEEVASWFDDVTAPELGRRLRVNVEVGGVPAFWEDRFVGEGAPAFEVGGVRFEGIEPCARCVIPERDPDTGERTEGFRETFVERREATFPEWADFDAFGHYYRLMLIAAVPEESRGETVRVGDDVTVVDAVEPCE